MEPAAPQTRDRPPPARLRASLGCSRAVLLRLAPYAVCRVPCAVCLVPCALCLVPCALCLVPCAVGLAALLLTASAAAQLRLSLHLNVAACGLRATDVFGQTRY